MAKDGKPQPITLWDAATGRPMRKGPRGRGANVTMRSLGLLARRQEVALGRQGHEDQSWDLETETVRTFEGHKGYHLA